MLLKSNCHRCGQHVLMLEMINGTWVPCIPHVIPYGPIAYVRTGQGRRGLLVDVRKAKQLAADTPRYQCHYATCKARTQAQQG